MPNFNIFDASLAAVAVWLLLKLSQRRRHAVKLSNLQGPPGASWLYGAFGEIQANGSAATHEKWTKAYGPVYRVPIALGSSWVVIFDTKVLSQIFAKDSFVYVQPPFMKNAIESFFGKGLLWSEGESHRRQRKVLNPIFNVSSIRTKLPAFYDSAYKIKSAWESIIQQTSSEEVPIDISSWTNGFSLDSIGLALFGHDFGALDGTTPEILHLIDSLGSTGPTKLDTIITRLSLVLPFLHYIPTTRSRTIGKIHECLGEIANALLDRNARECEAHERSVIAALLKAEESERMSSDEVLTQMRTLLLAGYEVTAIGLTYALIDLAKNPEAQDKLRKELLSLPTREPSEDHIFNSEALPYLSAFVQESLRLHPPNGQIIRVASQDEVMALSSPIIGKSGENLESITIPKGTAVNIPLRSINLSEAFWGPDAKVFAPERWLDNEQGITGKATEIQGYHHMLTFLDGHRMCLGRNIAVAGMKTLLTVLVRNFTFEMRDGPDTKVETVMNMFPRPKVAGSEGYAMPLKIKVFEDF